MDIFDTFDIFAFFQAETRTSKMLKIGHLRHLPVSYGRTHAFKTFATDSLRTPDKTGTLFECIQQSRDKIKDREARVPVFLGPLKNLKERRLI